MHGIGFFDICIVLWDMRRAVVRLKRRPGVWSNAYIRRALSRPPSGHEADPPSVASTLPPPSPSNIVSKSILQHLPQYDPTAPSTEPLLRALLTNDLKRLVVLDDDPTGCQTVYDVNVLFDYSVEVHKLLFIPTYHQIYD
jgi:hypothetical protein